MQIIDISGVNATKLNKGYILNAIKKATDAKIIGIRALVGVQFRNFEEIDIDNIELNNVVFKDGDEWLDLKTFIDNEIFYDVYCDLIDNYEDVCKFRDQALEILSDKTFELEILEMIKACLGK